MTIRDLDLWSLHRNLSAVCPSSSARPASAPGSTRTALTTPEAPAVRREAGRGLVETKAAQPPSVTIRQIEFDSFGMGLPYDAERVMQLRNMLREARKRKLSRALAAKRELPRS